MRTTDKQNLTAPNGACFFALQRADGTFEGERYVGFCESFAATITTERLELYASNCGPREKVRDIPTQTDRAASFSLRDLSPENMRMMMMGEVAKHTQAATPVVDEEITDVQKGRYYYVGVTASNPVGVGEISPTGVSVKVASSSMVLGTDYEVDHKRGRIYIIPGGAIADDADIKVSYTPVAKTYTRINSGNNAIRGRFRIEACNVDGINRDTIIPLMDVSPTGDVSLITNSEYVQLNFEGRIIKLPNVPAMILNGVEV